MGIPKINVKVYEDDKEKDSEHEEEYQNINNNIESNKDISKELKQETKMINNINRQNNSEIEKGIQSCSLNIEIGKINKENECQKSIIKMENFIKKNIMTNKSMNLY